MVNLPECKCTRLYCFSIFGFVLEEGAIGLKWIKQIRHACYSHDLYINQIWQAALHVLQLVYAAFPLCAYPIECFQIINYS